MGATAGHPHPHPHAHGPGVQRWAAVLDVGDDVGALLLYTRAELVGSEIDVSPVDDPTRRTHTEVLERVLGDRVTYAALYAALPTGTYRIWHDDPHNDRPVTINGGEVAQVDWR